MSKPMRIFLVGCPRSGTTLTQGLIAAHPQIISFPETHMFSARLPGRRWLARLGWVSGEGREHLQNFAREVRKTWGTAPRIGFRRQAIARGLFAWMDDVARQAGAIAWLEKTPGHLHHLVEIEAMFPEARFIHLVRSGENAVASMYDVAKKYGGNWRHFSSVEQCVSRWNEDCLTSKTWLDKPRHVHLRFEDVVQDPATPLQKICAFLGVDFDASMVQSQKAVAGSLVTSNEAWKQGTFSGVGEVKRKFDEVLTSKEQAWVRTHLLDLDDWLPRQVLLNP